MRGRHVNNEADSTSGSSASDRRAPGGARGSGASGAAGGARSSGGSSGRGSRDDSERDGRGGAGGASRGGVRANRPAGERTERAYRPGGGARPPFRSNDERATKRPRWEDRGERPARSAGDRGDGPSRPVGERTERPYRPAGGARPPFRSNDERAAKRPRWEDRSERPARSAGDRGDRPSRPVGERTERPYRPAGERTQRPAGERTQRPRWEDRGERPARSAGDRSDRPSRPSGERTERPYRSAGERTERSGNRTERSDNRSSERSSRPVGEHSDRPFRPAGERSDRPSGGARAPFKPNDDRPTTQRPPTQDRRERSDNRGTERPSRPSGGRTDRRDRVESDPRGRSSGLRREPNPDDHRLTRSPEAERVVAPEIPADVQFSDLDRRVRARLRTLSKENAEGVGQHLVMAGRLLDTDPELAYEHAQAAVRRAGRVDVVREAAGLAAYRTGRFAEALRELRTVRRLNGSSEHLAIMADCERGLGRPERALALAASDESAGLEREAAIELAIVVSGARLDLGEPEAAHAALTESVLARLGGATGVLAVRVAQARAAALEALGVPDAVSSLAGFSAAAPAVAIGESVEEEDDVVVFDLDEGAGAVVDEEGGA